MTRAHFGNSAFDLVVVAASAGGLEAIHALLSRLPPSFPAPLALVLHLSRQAVSVLPEVLRRASRLQSLWAKDGMRLRAGTVYVAPPNYHLTVTADLRAQLDQTALVHYTRPAADPLFESAARLGPRALGVVLSGYGRDGAVGARVMRDAGGTVLVQDPAECLAREMPVAALRLGAADFVLPAEVIGSAITTLVMVPHATAQFGVRARWFDESLGEGF